MIAGASASDRSHIVNGVVPAAPMDGELEPAVTNVTDRVPPAAEATLCTLFACMAWNSVRVPATYRSTNAALCSVVRYMCATMSFSIVVGS